MVEPTKTETSKETLDAFVDAIAEILREAAADGPEVAQSGVHDHRLRRLARWRRPSPRSSARPWAEGWRPWRSRTSIAAVPASRLVRSAWSDDVRGVGEHSTTGYRSGSFIARSTRASTSSTPPTCTARRVRGDRRQALAGARRDSVRARHAKVHGKMHDEEGGFGDSITSATRAAESFRRSRTASDA